MPTARNTWKSGTTRRTSNTTSRTTSRGGSTSNGRNTSGGFWNTTGRGGYGSFGTGNSWSSGRGTTGGTGGTGGTGWTTSKTYSTNQFSTQRRELNCKIESYRTINQQCSGAGRVTAFSPTTCKQWINYVDNGCFVYNFNNAQFCRYFGNQFGNCSPTQAFRTLRSKFGTGIKAVTRGKGNSWLVAATPRVTSRAFTNYNW